MTLGPDNPFGYCHETIEEYKAIAEQFPEIKGLDIREFKPMVMQGLRDIGVPFIDENLMTGLMSGREFRLRICEHFGRDFPDAPVGLFLRRLYKFVQERKCETSALQ